MFRVEKEKCAVMGKLHLTRDDFCMIFNSHFDILIKKLIVIEAKI